MAMAWRCPPDKPPTFARTDCSVRTCNCSIAFFAFASISKLSIGRMNLGKKDQPLLTGSEPSDRLAATSKFSQSAKS